MLSFEQREKVRKRYEHFKQENNQDRTKTYHMLAWLGMMGLLDEEAIQDLVEDDV